jgi:hypothetical protein
MGKPLMITLEDDIRLLSLREKTGAKSKMEVIRNALTLLEQQISREERVSRWKKSAKIVAESSAAALNDFKTKKRFENLP